MAVAANEPYQRVSRDNGVFDGALIGAAVGAGGAGAGIFGARMSYNGIEKKANRMLSDMQGNLDNLADKEARINQRTDKKTDRIVNRERTVHMDSIDEQLNQQYNQRRVEKPLDRLDRAHQKNMGKVHDRMNKIVGEFDTVSQPNYVKDRKAAHAYSKMGGSWKKAGIIGASAVVAGGVGMIADGIQN